MSTKLPIEIWDSTRKWGKHDQKFNLGNLIKMKSADFQTTSPENFRKRPDLLTCIIIDGIGNWDLFRHPRGLKLRIPDLKLIPFLTKRPI